MVTILAINFTFIRNAEFHIDFRRNHISRCATKLSQPSAAKVFQLRRARKRNNIFTSLLNSDGNISHRSGELVRKLVLIFHEIGARTNAKSPPATETVPLHHSEAENIPEIINSNNRAILSSTLGNFLIVACRRSAYETFKKLLDLLPKIAISSVDERLLFSSELQFLTREIPSLNISSIFKYI